MADKFWTEGPGRLQNAPETKRKIDRLEREIKFRYKPELAQANFIGKIFVRLKIRREIKKEIDKIIPPNALW